MNKPIKYLLVVCFSITAIGLLSLLLLPKISYTSTHVKEGEFFGLSIGQSKIQAYENLPKVLGELDSNQVYFRGQKLDLEASKLLSMRANDILLFQTRLLEEEYSHYRELDVWEIYLRGDWSAFLRVKFSDGEVSEIYYHNQRFELP